MLADLFVLAFSKQSIDRARNECKGKKEEKKSNLVTQIIVVSLNEDLGNNQQI